MFKKMTKHMSHWIAGHPCLKELLNTYVSLDSRASVFKRMIKHICLTGKQGIHVQKND